MVGRRSRRATALILAVTVTAGLATWAGAGTAAAWPWDNIGDRAEQAAVGLVARIVNAILYALISLMKYVMSFFTAQRTNVDGNAFSAMVEWANDYTYQLQSAFLLGSVLLVGARFAIAQWSGGTQAAVTSGLSVSVRALATSVGSATVVILLARASDIFAAWIYDDTGDRVNQVTDEVKRKIGTIDSHNFDGSSLLLVIIALIAVLGCLDLILQLFLRVFYLVFGTALLPIAAAASGTEGGQSTYGQVIKLLAAMLAFKPICAGAFALAMSFPLDNQSNANDVFTAVLLYVSPILCLPTLLSLVGVGGSVHGRVSGLAGVAALIGGGRVASRLGGKTMRGVTGAAGRMGGGGKGGGGGGSRPSGTSPTPPRGGSGGTRPGGGGGRFAPAAFASGGGSKGGSGGPRSASSAAPASAKSSGRAASARSGDQGSPRHASASSSRDSGTAPSTGRHSSAAPSGPERPSPTRNPSSSNTAGRGAETGSPRASRPPNAPPRSTVSSARSAGGDRRNNAKNIARRNLGAHYIGRR